MGHDEELHEPVIDVPRGSRLDDEDILVSNRFTNGNTGLQISFNTSLQLLDCRIHHNTHLVSWFE